MVIAKSGIGQLDKTGVLCITFASGKAIIATLHKPEGIEGFAG